MDCPDLKANIEIFMTDGETCDICQNMMVDGRNHHDCTELCTTGYNGKRCPRGFQRWTQMSEKRIGRQRLHLIVQEENPESDTPLTCVSSAAICGGECTTMAQRTWTVMQIAGESVNSTTAQLRGITNERRYVISARMAYKLVIWSYVIRYHSILNNHSIISSIPRHHSPGNHLLVYL